MVYLLSFLRIEKL